MLEKESRDATECVSWLIYVDRTIEFQNLQLIFMTSALRLLF